MDQDTGFATEMWTSPYQPKGKPWRLPQEVVHQINRVLPGGVTLEDGTITKPQNTKKLHAKCEHCGYPFITPYVRQCRRIDDWFSGIIWVCKQCRDHNHDTYTIVEE